MREKVLKEECIVNGNSLFIIDAKDIIDVLNEDGSVVEFDYSVNHKVLTTIGIYDSVFVLYE